MSDFKNKTKEELHKELMEKRSALRAFRFNISASKVKNVKEGINLRKEIARILTALTAKSKA